MWDIILAERAKRSIIFTTHFLDEGDVLADHIVILSKGHIKCQGSVAELKSQYGGGYRIHLPEADSVQGQSLPGLVHHDGVVYKAEDSRSAAKLVSQLEVDGHKGVQMTGPTIEDVFLNLTKEDVPSDSDEATIHDSTEEYLSKQLSPGQGTSFWKQVRILLRKRLTILPRYWMSTCLALVLPIACVPAINKFVAEDFRRSDCKPIGYNSDQNGYLTTYFGVYLGSNPASHPYYYRPNAIGPPSANESLYKVLRDFPIGESFNISRYAQNFEFLNDLDSFHQYLSDTNKISPNDGGIYVGDDSTTPEIASTYSIGRFAAQGLNILSQVRSGVPIAMYQASRNLYYYEVGTISLLLASSSPLVPIPTDLSIFCTYGLTSSVPHLTGFRKRLVGLRRLRVLHPRRLPVLLLSISSLRKDSSNQGPPILQRRAASSVMDGLLPLRLCLCANCVHRLLPDHIRPVQPCLVATTVHAPAVHPVRHHWHPDQLHLLHQSPLSTHGIPVDYWIHGSLLLCSGSSLHSKQPRPLLPRLPLKRTYN